MAYRKNNWRPEQGAKLLLEMCYAKTSNTTPSCGFLCNIETNLKFLKHEVTSTHYLLPLQTVIQYMFKLKYQTTININFKYHFLTHYIIPEVWLIQGV